MERDGEILYRTAALTQWGMDLYDRGGYDAAIDLFKQALALTPTYVRALRGKALCLSQLGRAAEALTFAREAVALAPTSGLAFATLGLCYHRLGQRGDADDAFAAGLRLTPDDYRVYYNYACYLAEIGNEEKCRENLKLALELAPASFAGIPGGDPDLARYSRQGWFLDLLAGLRARNR